MGFREICVKGKWWLAAGGVLTLPFGFGIILLCMGVYGFMKSNGQNPHPSVGLITPISFEYPKEFVKKNAESGNYLMACPVCKSKNVVPLTNDEEASFWGSMCKRCNAEFSFAGKSDCRPGEALFKCSVRKCSEQYQNYDYSDKALPAPEWNALAKGGKTYRELLLAKLRHGDDLPDINPKNVNECLNSALPFSERERCHAFTRAVLYEPRSVRNYGGASVRVAKGVSVRLGQAESHDEMRKIELGVLALTNRRLLFTGGQRNSNIDLRKIVNIKKYGDGVQVSIDSRQRPQFFALEDPALWQALLLGAIRNIAGRDNV